MGRNLYARLVAYQPHGDRIGVLPQPASFDALQEWDETGSLSFEYSMLTVGGDTISRQLSTGTEIAVEVSDGGAWVEPASMRYLIIKREGDQTDTTGTLKFTCVSYGWLLNKILNLNTSALRADGDNKGKRPFLSATAGTIISTFVDENKARGGAGAYLAPGFDTGKDSAGASWSRVSTLYYSLGVSLKTVIDGLVQGGVIDWDTQGRTLRVWSADSIKRSRDLSTTVIVQLAKDVLGIPYEESIEDLSSHILVSGDNDLIFTEDNPAAPTPWGKWESYVSQGGVSDKGTAQAFMQAELASSARMRGSYTAEMLTVDATNLPLIDYQCGDWITAPTISHGEKTRVQQIKLALDNTNGGASITCSVTLNDALMDSQVRQSKKINGITGGAALAGSESSRPAPAQDHRVPKAPEGLVLASDAYLDSTGHARGLVSAVWGDVSQATDNTAIEIDSYRVEWRYSDEGDKWRSAGVTSDERLSWSNLDCGRTVVVRVRAIPTYSDKPGKWSGEKSVTVASDVTPPAVPSAPRLSSETGIVSISWDGLPATGTGMDADFDHCEVGRGLTSGSLAVVSASMTGRTQWVDTDVLPGAVWIYALRAVDHAGNKSAWSKTAQIEVVGAVSQEQIDKIQSDLAENEKTLDQAKKDIQANQSAISQTQQTVSQVKTDVSGVKTDLTGVKTDLSGVKTDLDEAQSDLTKVSNDLTAANEELASVGKTASDAASKAQQAIADAASAQTTADGRNRIWHDWQDPTVTDPTIKPVAGDLWYRYQRFWTRAQGEPDNSPSLLANFYTYSEGEPDNSPSVLVPLESEIVEVLMWDGDSWNPYTLVASNVVASGTITGDLIAASTILADHLAAGSVTTDKLVSLAVTADKLAANSVTAGKIAALAVTADKLAANAVTAGKIAANAVTAGTIAAGAVTTDKLAALSVTAAKIAALTITGDKIAANAINADKLAANAVTADKLAANSVNSSKIVAGAITADKLAANSVTAVAIAAGSITTDKIKAGQFQGYVFTGAIYQSSTAEDTGFKLRDSGLDMWDSSHNHTVHLDGEGKSNLLTGTFQTALSGRRVRISPDFTQHEVDDPGVSIVGSGIQLFLDGTAAAHPYIATESSVSDEGQVSGIVINGGRRDDGDPGAFLRIGERGASGDRHGIVRLSASQKYSDASSPLSYLELYSPHSSGPTAIIRANNGTRYAGYYANSDRASSYMYAGDSNGTVGMQADINTGYLYLGGYLGGLTGRSTFQAAQWRYNNGTFNAGINFNKAQCTLNPAKYGRYFAVASSDTDAYGIFMHVANTGNASSVQVMGRNAGGTFTGEIYAAVLAWLHA